MEANYGSSHRRSIERDSLNAILSVDRFASNISLDRYAAAKYNVFPSRITDAPEKNTTPAVGAFKK